MLDAAERLMLAKGFVATTVDEICAAARVTKGSFFHYFKSKEELGKAALDRFCNVRHQAMLGTPARKKTNPLERILGTVDLAIEMSRSPLAQNGCLLGNFAQELSDSHPGIRALCARRFTEWAALLKRDLDEAKAAYLPKSRLDTESLAEHFIAIIEGALILAKAKRDMGVMEKSLRHFRRYLENSFEREN
ncbi:MAG TPA: TetR family transcriptional regulator [Candidatus Binatia bacterium]